MKALNTIALPMLDLIASAKAHGGRGASHLAAHRATNGAPGFVRYWLAEHHNLQGTAN